MKERNEKESEKMTGEKKKERKRKDEEINNGIKGWKRKTKCMKKKRH